MAIYLNGEIDYARGYGMANLEYDIANGPNTVFRIGSTSKQFTAMAIALLAEQGKLSLEDDIHKFFPQMPDYGAPVTVRQLVHHTSGIRDYLELAWMADWAELYTVEEAVSIVTSQQALNFPPNSAHLYSNAGYFLMSQIVEIITDQSLHEWAEENMFTPLGMANTHFHDDHTHIVPNRADGYADGDGEGFKISMTQLDMVGDGGIYTTVTDMLQWDRNFYDNQLGKGGPALIELVKTPGVLDDGEVLDYAFGLSVGEFQGTPEISHGGAFVGYRAGYNFYPDHHLGVAVFCNYANTDPTGLAQQVAALYLGVGESEDEGAGPGSEKADTGEEILNVSSAELERMVGDFWRVESLDSRSITVDDNKLWYMRGGGNRTRLDPIGNDRFLMADVGVRVVVSFEPALESPRLMTVEVPDQEPWIFQRIEKESPSTESLAGYAGAYYSTELDHTQVLTLERDALLAIRRGDDQALEPLQHDTFVTEEGFVFEFNRDDNGTITGFGLNSGRVRNIGYQRR
jgi:CubicO group peptidase (beta-lactamase class C family)